VPPQVDGHRLKSTFSDGRGHPRPGAAGLAAAVQKDHGTRLGITLAVRDDPDASRSVGGERFSRARHRSHQQILGV
jgi:hypothetical protein